MHYHAVEFDDYFFYCHFLILYAQELALVKDIIRVSNISIFIIGSLKRTVKFHGYHSISSLYIHNEHCNVKSTLMYIVAYCREMQLHHLVTGLGFIFLSYRMDTTLDNVVVFDKCISCVNSIMIR